MVLVYPVASWQQPNQTPLSEIFDSSLVVNYSAKEVVFTLDSGENRVSQWTDRSGNNFHATQATSSLRPIYISTGFNGMPCLDFQNTRWMQMPNCLDSTWGQASLFILYALDSADFFVAMQTGSAGDVYWGSGSVFQFKSWFGEFRNVRLDELPGSGVITQTGQALIEVISGTAPGTYKINRNAVNVLSVDPSWGVTATPYIGRNPENTRKMPGKIAEIAIINRVATEAEILSTRNYFKNEWNLSVY